MNPWQVTQNLVSVLSLLEWPAGDQRPIYQPPAAPTIAAGGVGGIPAGTYRVSIAYLYTATGYRTPASPLSNALALNGSQVMVVTLGDARPAGTDVVIYVTSASGTGEPLWQVATFSGAFPASFGFTASIFAGAPATAATLAGTLSTQTLERVLSRVAVTPGTPDFFKRDAVAPFVLIHPEAGRPHPEHPADLVEEARWTAYLFAANATDQAGGAAVVGGNRGGLSTSRGRGLLEVAPLLEGAILASTGLVARARPGGRQPVAVAGRMEGVLAEVALEVMATRLPALPDYAPVRKLAGSGSAGDVSLTWEAAPARWDLVGYTWVRASGSVAPASPAGGTFVASTTPSLDDSPGAGTWSYSIFWTFDATRDPYTRIGTAPVAPNAWSSQRSARSGLMWLPASLTVAA